LGNSSECPAFVYTYTFTYIWLYLPRTIAYSLLALIALNELEIKATTSS